MLDCGSGLVVTAVAMPLITCDEAQLTGALLAVAQ